jgi:hypothetical protein
MSPENIGIITFQHHNFVKAKIPRRSRRHHKYQCRASFFLGQERRERLLLGEEDKEQLA